MHPRLRVRLRALPHTSARQRCPGLALGDLAGARSAERPAIPVGADALLRMVSIASGSDTTNPLKADMSGLEVGTTTSAGEQVAQAVPGARVVKAVPPFAEVPHSPTTQVGGGYRCVFVCGDDAEARRLVLGLIAEFGADGVDAGPLQFARYTEPLGMLLVELAYRQGMDARIGAALLRAVIVGISPGLGAALA